MDTAAQSSGQGRAPWRPEVRPKITQPAHAENLLFEKVPQSQKFLESFYSPLCAKIVSIEQRGRSGGAG